MLAVVVLRIYNPLVFYPFRLSWVILFRFRRTMKSVFGTARPRVSILMANWIVRLSLILAFKRRTLACIFARMPSSMVSVLGMIRRTFP